MRADIQGKVNRLKVFATVKRWMEETGECPTATDIAPLVDLMPAAVSVHMQSLMNATGLPGVITDGWRRTAYARWHSDRSQPIVDTTQFFEQNGAV